MTGIQIELKLRPCYISIEKGKKEKLYFMVGILLVTLLRISQEL